MKVTLKGSVVKGYFSGTIMPIVMADPCSKLNCSHLFRAISAYDYIIKLDVWMFLENIFYDHL